MHSGGVPSADHFGEAQACVVPALIAHRACLDQIISLVLFLPFLVLFLLRPSPLRTLQSTQCHLTFAVELGHVIQRLYSAAQSHEQPRGPSDLGTRIAKSLERLDRSQGSARSHHT